MSALIDYLWRDRSRIAWRGEWATMLALEDALDVLADELARRR
jgi:hypothetical protein